MEGKEKTTLERIREYNTKVRLLASGMPEIDDKTRRIEVSPSTRGYNGKQLIVPSLATEVGTGAFRGNESIETLVFMDGVKRIRQQAFINMKLLREVRFSDSIENIGYEAFESSFWDGSTILRLPNNKRLKVDSSAFGYNKLKKIIIPDKVDGTNLQNGVFMYTECAEAEYECKSLIRIMNSAFKGNSILKRVVTAGRLGYIGGDAFYECPELEDIDLRYAIYIGSRAFMGDNSLKEIELDNINDIGEYAFAGCKELNKVIVRSERVQSLGRSCFDGINLEIICKHVQVYNMFVLWRQRELAGKEVSEDYIRIRLDRKI